jgi:hypothetical protein
MSRGERARFLVEHGSDGYMDLIPLDRGYWYQICDALAKTGGLEEPVESPLRRRVRLRAEGWI